MCESKRFTFLGLPMFLFKYKLDTPNNTKLMIVFKIKSFGIDVVVYTNIDEGPGFGLNGSVSRPVTEVRFEEAMEAYISALRDHGISEKDICDAVDSLLSSLEENGIIHVYGKDKNLNTT